MDLTTQVLSSTLLLTLVLMAGLLSFLKSSVKDRTTEMLFKTDDQQLLGQVRDHFKNRAYQVIKVDGDRETVTFAGRVRPSIFLAILLVITAAIGMGCLGLVLSILEPFFSDNWWLLMLIAPAAGVFYWRGSDRVEEISLQWRPISDSNVNFNLWVRGHKDELTELQRSLHLEKIA